MKLPRLLLPFALVGMIACGSDEGGFDPPTDEVGGTITFESIRVDGQPRGYWIFVPENLPPQNRPTLVALHGEGSDGGRMLDMTGLDFLADSLGIVAVFPNAQQTSWTFQDTTFLRLLQDSLVVRHGTDPTGVHLMGYSQGAGLAQVLVCEGIQEFKSLNVLGNTLPRERAEGCEPPGPIHAFYLMGTRDPVAPWLETAEALGGEPTVEWWADTNGCEAEPDRVENDVTIRLNWTSCQMGARVRLIAVIGGEHDFFPLETFNTLGELVDWLGPIL